MKKYINFQTITIFLIEVFIPIICVPILPKFFLECNEMDAFIVGTCISIFLAIWLIDYKYHTKLVENSSNCNELRKDIEDIQRTINGIETYQKFTTKIDGMHPYFKKHLQNALEKNFDDFNEKNKKMIEGYVETTPYESMTFGTEGILWTKKCLLAVTSIDDYWERDNFVNKYLQAQIELIESRNITVKRIFILKNDQFKKLESMMKFQKENGISVYYINANSEYFNKEWIDEDFLIQDNELLVDLKCSSHKYGDVGKEIITVNESLVHTKIDLFNSMMRNSTAY